MQPKKRQQNTRQDWNKRPKINSVWSVRVRCNDAADNENALLMPIILNQLFCSIIRECIASVAHHFFLSFLVASVLLSGRLYYQNEVGISGGIVRIFFCGRLRTTLKCRHINFCQDFDGFFSVLWRWMRIIRMDGRVNGASAIKHQWQLPKWDSFDFEAFFLLLLFILSLNIVEQRRCVRSDIYDDTIMKPTCKARRIKVRCQDEFKKSITLFCKHCDEFAFTQTGRLIYMERGNENRESELTGP